ncbi:MAG: hypothetical protein HY701_09125, partial [Gemmatimonadetes bacterium]|nr:hypothetical protein [Gemmatimonadota bacterium]
TPALEPFAVLDPQLPANERVWEVSERGLGEAGLGAATAPGPRCDSQTMAPVVLSMAGLATRYLMWRPNARLLGPPDSAAAELRAVSWGRRAAAPARPFLLLESF